MQGVQAGLRGVGGEEVALGGHVDGKELARAGAGLVFIIFFFFIIIVVLLFILIRAKKCKVK